MEKSRVTDPPLEHLRHSLAHLLGAAVLDLYPGSKLAIGPAVEHGFYYDVDVNGTISEADLPRLEAAMRRLLKTWRTFDRREVDAADARRQFAGNPYKLELVDEIVSRGEPVTLYTSGSFTDLCRGGHVDDARRLGSAGFRLHRLAGAYWRGDEKNKQLTRVYGLAFASADELEAHLKLLEEAERRDHRRVGPALDLFMFHETAPGMPYWLPHGVTLMNELVDFWRQEHAARGYQEIVSPLLNKKELYVISGHFEHYWQDMFVCQTPEGEAYGVKAMNCPNAMVVFASRSRSYRDLPLRFSDMDTLHRFERSGTLNGLLRVREFRQDDAHIFVAPEQVGEEYVNIFAIVERFYSIFDMAYSFRLGTRPASFMGDAATWDEAEATLTRILQASGRPYAVAAGEGAFYGPKVDILVKDVLGREWQMGTVQLDFQQPRRFALEYVAADGSRRTPVAIHRVVYGSLERFVGILIEHYGGAFPVWLAPVQVAVVPVGEGHAVAAREARAADETVNKRIRAAEHAKVPYVLVIGDRELPPEGRWGAEVPLAVRVRGQADLLQLNLGQFLGRLAEEITERRNSP
jgi:threonyl-tRNA synthetase